jgi:hypothetical protein
METFAKRRLLNFVELIYKNIKTLFAMSEDTPVEPVEQPTQPEQSNPDPKPPKRKRSPGANKKKKEPSETTPAISKRRVARPYAKLDQAILDSRLDKLKKRVDKSKSNYDKSSKYYEKYKREADLREQGVPTQDH